MQALTIFTKSAAILSEIFYPAHCAGCGHALFGKSKLCETCWNQVARLPEHFCLRCSYPLQAAARSCENCADRKLHFVAGVSAFLHQGLMRQLLAQLKYARDQSLKKLMGECIAIALRDERLRAVKFEAVVPVPLHFLRERERGFNQAWLIADEVARECNLPIKNILYRLKPTATQVFFDRQERIKNLQRAFALKKEQRLFGNYLVVDDVLTTGSTLDACAQALLSAGADAVWGVTVARG